MPFFINLMHGTSAALGFTQWLTMLRNFGPAMGKASLLWECLRLLAIEVQDEIGKVLCVYPHSRCRLAEYRAVSGADAIGIGHLYLGFGSWMRDPPEKQ